MEGKTFCLRFKENKTNREKYVAARLFRHQVYKSPEITGKSSPLFSCRHLDSRPNLFNRICLFERSLSAFTTPSWPHLRLRQSAIDSQHRHGHHTCCYHDHRPSPNTFQICSLGHWGMKPRANMSWKNPPTLCFWDTCTCRLLVAEAGQVSLSMQRVIQIQRYKLKRQPEKQVWISALSVSSKWFNGDPTKAPPAATRKEFYTGRPQRGHMFMYHRGSWLSLG
jgi:hypothetical protein